MSHSLVEDDKPSKCEEICDIGECDYYWTAEAECENCPGYYSEEEDWKRS